MEEFFGAPWFFWGVLIAAIASLIGLIVNSVLSSRRDRRHAAASIAEHRVVWIKELRESITRLTKQALLVSLSLDQEGEPSDTEAYVELQEVATKVFLLLNPTEHSELRQYIREFFNPIQDTKKYNIEHVGKLREATERVLKAEWELAKTETMGQSDALEATMKKVGASFEFLGLRVSFRLIP